jgi:hypothetical protein
MPPTGDISPTQALAGPVPKLAKYEVLSKLASGGMAEIFVAQRHGADNIASVLPPDAAAASSESAAEDAAGPE